MKAAGLDLKFTDEFIYPPKSRDIERLMKSLKQIIPGKKSRVMTLNEYHETIKWSEENDRDLFLNLLSQFEVFYDDDKNNYVVNIDKEFEFLDKYPRDFPIGLRVREVIG